MEYHCKYDVLVEPADLLDHPRNHNKHPERQLAALEAFIRHSGWRHPAVVSKLSGKLVAGHARKEAALRLGCQVPVVYQDFESDAEERTFLAADNKLAELAEMDVELLDVEVLELEELEVPIYDFGFDRSKPKPVEKSSCSPVPKQDTLVGPTDEEHARLDGKIFLVEFSGGIDSSASVLWLMQYYPNAVVKLLYVDMGADYYGMHDFLFNFAEHVGCELITLRAPENIIDRLYHEGAWPHAMHPYCHELLHAALDGAEKQYATEEVVIVRGGRASERSGNTKIKDDRFLKIDRMAAYTYFQPLYFCDKSVGRHEIETAGWPIWPGYDTGLGRTACRVCPGQNQGTYAAIRKQYPAVWAELLSLQQRLGCGAWNDPINNDFRGNFIELADRGDLKNT